MARSLDDLCAEMISIKPGEKKTYFLSDLPRSYTVWLMLFDQVHRQNPTLTTTRILSERPARLHVCHLDRQALLPY